MLRKTMRVRIKDGLDVRAMAELVQVASYYPCNVYLEKGKNRINAKSIMGMMSIGLLEGEEVVIAADGEQESDAIESIRQFLKD